MQFLKTLFWVIIAVIAAVFAMRNWTVVTLNLSAGFQLDAKLPVLLLIAFLVGWVPTYLLVLTTRWTLGRRIDGAERALADLRALEPQPSPVDAEPDAAGHRPLHTPPGIQP